MFMKKKKLCGLVMCFLLCTALVGCSVSETNNASITEINGSDIREFVDQDTGVHYLIYSCKLSNAGMGGITPRLNPDGTVMTTK